MVLLNNCLNNYFNKYIKHFIVDSDEWQPDNNKKKIANDSLIEKNNENKGTEDQIVKSMVNTDIDQSYNQSTRHIVTEKIDETAIASNESLMGLNSCKTLEYKQYIISNLKGLKKKPKKINCSKCRYKCTNHFDEHLRNMICHQYWNFNENEKKKFIRLNVFQKPMKYIFPISTTKHKKKLMIYSFKKNLNQIRVCKEFFTKTLRIGYKSIGRIFEGLVSEKG